MADNVSYKFLVTKTGTEKEFMAELISKITGLSDKITCSGSVDQYDSGDTSTVPEFTFSINGKPTLKIKRNRDIATATYLMDISIFVGNTIISSNEQCRFSAASTLPSVSGTRSLYISWIVSGNFILLAINTPYSDSGYIRYHVIANVKSGDNCYGDGYYVAYYGDIPRTSLFNIHNKPLNQSPEFVFTEYDTGANGSFVSRFAFASKPGQIDYIKSAAYINNNYKAFDITSIYDCTTVTIGDTVSLKDGAYLAVGDHQLVKVS